MMHSCRPAIVGAVALVLFSVAALSVAVPKSGTATVQRPLQALSLEVVDQLGGNLGAVAMVGDIVFAGVGPRVVALSSAGGSLQEHGRSEVLDGMVISLAAQSGRVAAITARGTFVVLDETDPAAGRLLGTTSLSATPERVSLYGDTAYVLGRQRGSSGPVGKLMVVELSDPAAPVELGSLPVEEPFTVAATSGGYCVVLDQLGNGHVRLLVVDAKEHGQPRVMSTVDLGEQDTAFGRDRIGGDVVTAGGMVYVVMPSDLGVVVLDLADPTQPRTTGQLKLPGVRVALAAEHLYVSQQDRPGFTGTLWHDVVDVSNPQRPTHVGRVPGIEVTHTVIGRTNLPVFVAAADGRLITARGAQIVVTTLTDPAHDAGQTTWTSTGVVDDVAENDASPPRLYTTRKEGVVGAVSAESSDTLAAAGHVQLPREWIANHIAASRLGGAAPLAYVSDARGQPSEFGVVDMADPDRPQLVGTVEIPDFSHDVAAADHWAVLVVTSWGLQPPLDTPTPRPTTTAVPTPTYRPPLISVRTGLRMVDASNPASPRLAGHVFVPYDQLIGGVVAIAGEHAYLGTDIGITVIHIADPDDPTIVGQLDFPTKVRALAAFGKRLVVAGSDVVRYDLADPARPTIDGQLGLSTGGPVALDASYAYVAVSETVKVYPLDAAWPTNPVAELALAAPPLAIVRDSAADLLAVAAGAAGLYSLELRDANATPRPTRTARPPSTPTPEPPPSAMAPTPTTTPTETHSHRVWLPWLMSSPSGG
jgi:hypothetical protein